MLPASTTHREQSAARTARISVAVRVRPPTQKESAALNAVSLNVQCNAGGGSSSGFGRMRRVVSILDDKIIVFDASPAIATPIPSVRLLRPATNSKRFKDIRYVFDKVFDENTSQRDVFEHTTRGLIDEIINGFNCTVFAYGATGCGKTFTMTGNEGNPGVIYLTMQALFDRIQSVTDTKQFDLTVSYLEIYNETIRDLLLGEGVVSQALDLREDAQQITVVGLSKRTPREAPDIMRLITMGNKNRTQSPTEANHESSRSHAVLQVTVRQRDRSANLKHDYVVATCNFIDLAGSERASVTKNRGDRLLEGANINRSLLALGNCINALCEDVKPQHIPYRDSKLTRLLKNALDGNCKTVMICAVAPTSNYYEATEATLRYASRAKNIKTNIDRNVYSVDYHVTEYTRIIKELRDELLVLRERSGDSNEISSCGPCLSTNISPETYNAMTTTLTNLTPALAAETNYQDMTDRVKNLIDAIQQQELDMIHIDARIHVIDRKLSILSEYVKKVTTANVDSSSIFSYDTLKYDMSQYEIEKDNLIQQKYQKGHQITDMRLAVQRAKREPLFLAMPELYQRLAAADIDGDMWQMNDILLSTKVDYLSNTSGIESMTVNLIRCHADLMQGVNMFLYESRSDYVDIPFLQDIVCKHDMTMTKALLNHSPITENITEKVLRLELQEMLPLPPPPPSQVQIGISNIEPSILTDNDQQVCNKVPSISSATPRRLSKTIKYGQYKRQTSRLSLKHNLTLQKLAQSGALQIEDEAPAQSTSSKRELKRRVSRLEMSTRAKTLESRQQSSSSICSTPTKSTMPTPIVTPKWRSSITLTTPSRARTTTDTPSSIRRLHLSTATTAARMTAGIPTAQVMPAPKTVLQTMNGIPKVMTRIPSSSSPAHSFSKKTSHRSRIPLLFKKESLSEVNWSFNNISKSPRIKAAWLHCHFGCTKALVQTGLFQNLQRVRNDTSGIQLPLQRHLSPARLLTNDDRGAVLLCLVQALLSSTASNSDILHICGHFALELAAQYNYVDCCQLLLSTRFTWLPGQLDIAFALACINGHIEMATLLLEQGANIHSKNEYALRWSCHNGHLTIVRMLIENGANVNAVRDHALFLALLQYYRCLSFIELHSIINPSLLRRSKTRSSHECNGIRMWPETLLAIKRKFVYQEVIQLLLQQGASAYKALHTRQTHASQFRVILRQLCEDFQVRYNNNGGNSHNSKLIQAEDDTWIRQSTIQLVHSRRRSNRVSNPLFKQSLLSAALLHPYSLAIGSIEANDVLISDRYITYNLTSILDL